LSCFRFRDGSILERGNRVHKVTEVTESKVLECLSCCSTTPRAGVHSGRRKELAKLWLG